jgi:hypothetical protein
MTARGQVAPAAWEALPPHCSGADRRGALLTPHPEIPVQLPMSRNTSAGGIHTFHNAR